MRIGHGYDVHRFVKGRKLMLCGVEVEYELGLLGALGCRCGPARPAEQHPGGAGPGGHRQAVPDRDPRYKDADSALLLGEVMRLAWERGYELGNCDITIVAQEPKLAPYIDSMRSRIAGICGWYRGADQRQGHHRGGSWLHRSAGGDRGPCGLPAPEAGDFSGKSVTPRPAAA